MPIQSPFPPPQPKPPTDRPAGDHRRPLFLDLPLVLLNIILLLSIATLICLGAWDLYFHPLSQSHPAWGKFLLAMVLAVIFRRLPV